MDDATTRELRHLLDRRPVAALGTLHRGEPAVSMVPFAVARLPTGTPDADSGTDGFAPQLVIHVSALASHTRNLIEHRRVSLLVMDEIAAGISPLELPRVSVDAMALPLERDAAGYTAARDAYLARLPDAEGLFALGDFRLVALVPLSARLVAGFGRAGSLVGDALHAWLASKP